MTYSEHELEFTFAKNRGYVYEKRAPPYVGMGPRLQKGPTQVSRGTCGGIYARVYNVRDSFGSC